MSDTLKQRDISRLFDDKPYRLFRDLHLKESNGNTGWTKHQYAQFTIGELMNHALEKPDYVEKKLKSLPQHQLMDMIEVILSNLAGNDIPVKRCKQKIAVLVQVCIEFGQRNRND